MTTKEGQGDSQPAEPVSLDSLASLLDGEGAGAEAEPGEDSEQVEEGEAEGEESPDESVEEQDEHAEPAFTIKHDGKEVTLKQSEVLELAQKGFDYTQKTMALGKDREAVEAQRSEAGELAKQRREAMAEAIQRLTAVTKLAQMQVGEPPSIELASQNAAQYLALKHAHEGQQAQLRHAYQELQQLNDTQARERHAALVAEAQETQKALVDTLPGWKDATHERISELHGYLTQHGLGPDAVPDAFVKKGLWEMAHKAKAFDALQADKAKLKPVQTPPKVIKTTAAQPPQLAQRQEALKRHKQAPSLSTLANLL